MWLSFITTEITNPLAPRKKDRLPSSSLYGTYKNSWFRVDSVLTDNALKRSLVAGPCLSLSLILLDRGWSSFFYSEPLVAMVKRRRDWGLGRGKELRSGFRPSSPRLHRSLRTRALDLLWPRSSLRASFPGVPVGTGVGKRTGPFSPCRLSAPGELVRRLT